MRVRARFSEGISEEIVTSTVIPLRQSAIGASLKHAAFDHLPAPAVCLNASAQVLALNPSAAALFESPAESLVGRHLSEFLSYGGPRRAARRWSRLWSRLLEHERVSVPAALPLVMGRRLIARLDAELMRAGQETVAVVLLRDVAADRVAAHRARAHEAQTRALAALRAGISGWIGADQRFISVSANARDVTGVGAEELRGLPVDYLLDEFSATEFAQAFARVLADDGTQVFRLRWRVRRRAGAAERWLECRLRNHLNDPWIRAIAFEADDVSGADAVQRKAEVLERRVRALALYSADLLMVLDGEGMVRYQSPVARSTLGIAPEASIGRAAADLVQHEDRAALRGAIDAVVRGDAHLRSCAAYVRRDDGTVRRFWFTVRDCGGDAAVDGVMLAAVDITDAPVSSAPAAASSAPAASSRKLVYRDRLLDLAIHTRSDWAQSLARVLRAGCETLECAGAGFWRRAVDGTEMCCESMFDRIADRYAHDWFGRQLTPEDYPRLAAGLGDRKALVFGAAELAAADAPPWPGTQALIVAPVLLDGEVLGLLTLHDTRPREWAEDDVEFATTAALVLSLAVEAVQRQQAESRIEQLAWYDSLTGLPNRNLLRESMRDMIMTAANRRRRIAVMLTDLDRFKDVNDTLGHLVGDALIKSAAQVLHETVGEAGVVARLGGDEFVVLVNEFEHRQEVALLAARIAQALNRTDLVPNVDTQVSASIGVALFPEHGRDMSTLLKNADSAMYQAKRDGRNQFSFFNPVRYERAAREVQLGIQLHKAVQSGAGQFFVEYQPQVELASGHVVGLEALIRWQHPMFGRLTPDSFIGIAEVSGLSERISRWVINEVCAQIVRWRAAVPGFDIPVSINVAGRELGTSALPMLVRGALLKHGVEPGMIVLEITERTLVHDSEINNDVMNELASLGVGIVLDDFGTGYSMLGYLKRMPIQALKIDQSFVKGIPEDADSSAIVHAMLAVARHFKLKVVAEGIESVEQVDYLRSIGCGYAQGYFFSRALEPQSILERVARDGALNPAPHGPLS
jgi:diguanylate cyclase (GGDEF)-like protein/PAS domain S-box-containing protein